MPRFKSHALRFVLPPFGSETTLEQTPRKPRSLRQPLDRERMPRIVSRFAVLAFTRHRPLTNHLSQITNHYSLLTLTDAHGDDADPGNAGANEPVLHGDEHGNAVHPEDRLVRARVDDAHHASADGHA